MDKKRSTRFKPCEHCPHRSGCEIKKDLRKRLRGIELKSADFDCEKRLSTLPRGQLVRCLGLEYVVMGPWRNRVLVWLLNPEMRLPVAKERDRYASTMLPDELEVGARIVPHCSECGRPDSSELLPADVHWCWKCQGYDSADERRTELNEMSEMQCYGR